MHPDYRQLAAYLDGALDPAEHAQLRAHILTCAACAARLERLRGDARRISAALASGSTPDLRPDVRARLRRPAYGGRLAQGLALAAATVGLFLFALLLATRSGATVGRSPDRLFVIDRLTRQLIELDAANGARGRTVTLGDQPSKIVYDRRLDRLYILLKQSVVAVDARTLGEIERWDAPTPFQLNAEIALDERRGWLFLARPDGVIALDRATLAPVPNFQAALAPGPLVLAPDGSALFTIDQQDNVVWKIDLPSAAAVAYPADPADLTRMGMLALSADGQTLYVLRSGAPPWLRRIDVSSGQASQPLSLAPGPAPWDLLHLGEGYLAIPRGDGQKGGITLVDTQNFRVTDIVDPDRDQHHLVAGPDGSLFSLNFSHNTVARYEPLRQSQSMWETSLGLPATGQPWDGVFVPGGWRWPWEA